MATKIPSEIDTRHREEMVCPNCFHEGLEPHPGYIDEYEGDAAILRATRCPNEDCTYHFGDGVPTDIIDEQFIRSSFLSGLTSGLDASTILMGLLILGGMVFLITNVLGIGIPGLTGGVDVTVAGEVVTADGSPVPNASVSIVNGSTTATTGSNGEYQLANLSAGTHVVSIEPREQALAASTVLVTVAEDGSVTANASNNATLDGQTLNIAVKDAVEVSADGSVANGSFLLDFANPANAHKGDGVHVSLTPPAGENVADETSVQTGTPRSIDIPGVLTSQELSIETGVVEQDVTRAATWEGSGSSVNLIGNLPPSSMTINVSPDANQHARTVNEEVSDGASFTETLRGNIDGEMEVTLWGGSATAPTTQTGTYSGNNPTIDIEEEAAPAQVTVEVTGDQSTTSELESGTLQSGSAEFSLDGDLSAQNAVIEFTGGTPEDAEVGDTSTSADATGGTQTDESVLFTAESAGEYRIEYDFTEDRHGNLVEAGYIVDGDRTPVSPGTGQTTLDLDSGDTVRLYVTAEQETNAQEKDFQRGNHDVYVANTEVSSTQVAPGEQLTVTATLENRGSSYGLDVYLFKDGEQADSENIFPDGGETVDVEFTTRFAEDGTHTVSVNEGDPITVQVGDGEPASGAGSISGSATRLGDGGTVEVDTDNDGTPDCTADASGGSCNLGSLSTGSHSVVASQQGVTGTGFTVTYDARFGAEDVSVDIDSDGVPDIEMDGTVADGETATGSASVDGGRNPILFEVGNGGSIEYEIRYTEAGQVTKPKMYVDGELAIDETENFKGERTYTLSDISAGTHTFEFESANASNTFNARLEWTESGSALYPSVTLNGETVCKSGEFASDRECTVSNPGSAGDRVMLGFEGGADTFEYGMTYTAKATPERVTVDAGGDSQQFTRSALSSENADGSWTKDVSVNMLEPGANHLSISAPTVDDLEPPATATFEYTYQAKKPTFPKVVVVNGENETFEKVVPESKLDANGFLQEEAQVSLDAEWFTRGENEIRIVAGNGGVLITEVTATTEHDGALRLAPAEEDS